MQADYTIKRSDDGVIFSIELPGNGTTRGRKVKHAFGLTKAEAEQLAKELCDAVR